ncbi:MAG: urea ABC transporter permease subunit UrtC, partial [Verrucomicrobia bacterium]|nr:urea ABC transporter permease subunit UrtC [Verrucomicrobiota bacterium]
MQNKFRRAELWGIGIGAILILGILPALNVFVPENSVFHLSDFTINLYGKYLAYAVLAMSVDLLWGYTGLLSLG